MYRLKSMGAALAASLLVASTAAAQLETPGSVLVYPTHRSGNPAAPATQAVLASFSILSVTNVNVDDATDVKFNYVNTVPNLSDPHLPLDCYVVDRVEYLTPADTLSVLTTCHNAAVAEGYVVISAQNPMVFDGNWSFNHLVGSEMVITSSGLRYSINAIPFSSPQNQGADTDLDLDGQLDFDGTEYECIPDLLYIDSFLALAGSSLTLLNLTGGTPFTSLVAFSVWNDNEQALSATRIFRCWFEQPLTDVSNVFSEYFLANNTPHDASELDVDCDDVGDLETGWAIIEGLVTNSTLESVPNPALLGAITNGTAAVIEGGRVLWGSRATQCNGDFLKFGVDDPEYPEPDLPPVCMLTVNGMTELVIQGVAAEVLTLDGTFSSDPDGVIETWTLAVNDTAGTFIGPVPPPIGPFPVQGSAFATPGMYFPELTVTDDDGLTSTCTVKITVNAPPLCSVLPAGPINVAPGNTVQFDGSGSSDPDGNNANLVYDWDYGDGALDLNAGPMPSHQYNAPGAYPVTLMLTDEDGGVSMCTTMVVVNQSPTCDIAITGQTVPPYVVMANMDVDFDGSGSNDPDGNNANLVYDWDYGDGNQDLDAGPMPTYQYTTPGTYTVVLTLTDEQGESEDCQLVLRVNAPPVCDAGPEQFVDIGESVTFNGSASFDPDGTIVQYDWLFDPPPPPPVAMDVGPNPTFTYTTFGDKTVTLRVFDNDGKTADCTTIVHVNALPLCEIQTDPSPPTVFASVPILFDGTDSLDPDGGSIANYRWEFDDGTPDVMGPGQGMVNHAFASPGTYTVKLTVTDDEGTMSMCTVEVVIPNQEPDCTNPTFSPPMPSIGDPVTFIGSANDPDGNNANLQYDWDFDDGTAVLVDGGPNPNHTFAMGGSFTVKMTVTDELGGSSMCSTVLVINRPPVCDAGGPYMVSLFQEITFDGSGSSDPDGDAITYDWDFGDGTLPNGTGAMPTHVYATSGDFTVTLTVTDELGASTLCTTIVTVKDVSGALAFVGDDAEEHCPATLCGGYMISLLDWCHDNSSNQGDGILAVGLQSAPFSLANNAFNSWLFEIDPGLQQNPPVATIPVTRVVSPAAFMAEDFDDYKMIYVPSYEEHTQGGIEQAMLDALFARKDDLADYALRRGGSLLVLTQAEDDDFSPQVMNGYTWSPIPFVVNPQRFFTAAVTPFGLNGAGGVPAPLPGVSNDPSPAGISHEAWHNTFLPVGSLPIGPPVGSFPPGIGAFVVENETLPGLPGEQAVIIGGIPAPVIPSMNMSNLPFSKDSALPGTGRGSNQQELVVGRR